MRFPWWLSLSVGFLSLSQELLWVRLVSYDQSGAPHAFSLVLTLYLIGIAAGAYVGKRFCDGSVNLYLVGGGTLLFAGATDILTIILAPKILANIFLTAPAIMMTAAIKSVLFPIAHHLGSNQSGPNVGSSVSKVYFGNIIGSTFGPILTGFYLLDHFTIERCFVVIGSLCIVLGVLTVSRATIGRAWAAVMGMAFAVFLLLRPWEDHDVVRHIAKRGDNRSHPVNHVIQNKHGILHTVHDTERGDIVYGGNVYDGRVNLDMNINANLLDRAYVLAATHPHPQRVLVVGMSTGAWTKIIAGFPGVEHIDVVEINPGYLELIGYYPELSNLLRDPRIHIHIDDARRWLKRHPSEKYDLIVQNTTYHWRANLTNLLSAEYFGELRKHMLPAAIAAINTTGSHDVYRTANEAFPYAFKYSNFVYGSDHDIHVAPQIALERLKRCRIDNAPAFSPDHFEEGGIARKLANHELVPTRDVLAAPYKVAPEVITDQNLVTEYRHGIYAKHRFLQWIQPPNPNAPL